MPLCSKTAGCSLPSKALRMVLSGIGTTFAKSGLVTPRRIIMREKRSASCFLMVPPSILFSVRWFFSFRTEGIGSLIPDFSDVEKRDNDCFRRVRRSHASARTVFIMGGYQVSKSTGG
jgi:hypothetical protein